MINYYPFGELLGNVVDNRGKTCPTADIGIPLIATNCISNDFLYPLFEKVRYVDDQTYENWFRGHPLPGDMIFVLKGTPGRIAWVPNPVTFCIAQDMVAIRANEERIYPKYLFAALRSKTIQQEIEGLHVGTMIPHFKKGDFDDLQIPVPDRDLQKFIGDQYFDISLKIDLLQRQNRTLESLAQALFRHWFSDGAGADWEEKPLDEIATFLNGLACQKYPPENDIDRLPVLKIKDLRSGLDEQSDWATSDVPEEYIVENGDVIFSWSGSLMVKIWDGKQCVLNQHLFKVTSEQYPKWFYYFWTIHHLQKFISIAESKATTMGHIKRSDLSTSMTFVPSTAELNEMDQTFAPLIDKIVLNNQQIASLTTLRDSLLPKLMSGEIGVSQVSSQDGERNG